MIEVLGIVFKKAGDIYYYKPIDEELSVGDKVVAETRRGIELGEVVKDLKKIDENELDHGLNSIIRKATSKDLEKHKQNIKEAEEAFDICLKKIKKHGLPMKLIDSEYTFDKGKLLFYFTADGRVDFRELVKDLASVFRTRIELRQIGVRDETKMMGGIGPCGRRLCCKTFLRDFEPISIQIAKAQDLSLNPEKISGICGRLMCCLKYEAKNYRRIKKRLPNVGDEVEVCGDKGDVVGLNVIKKTVKVKLNGAETVEVDVDKIEMVDSVKD